jgi:hypothetical protein
MNSTMQHLGGMARGSGLGWSWRWAVFLGGLLLTLAWGVRAEAQESICARVKIEILQELTLEREAFEARMTIHNGVVGTAIDSLSVDVSFADGNRQSVRATSNPNDLTSLFFIRLQDGYSIPSTVAGGTSATIKWLIIPARGAAGSTALGETYFVGAKLRYRAAGVDNEVVVEPDDILVKPMPALTLDYFLPDEVNGDDPFTENFVEPPIVFSLGVRVKNTGLGAARKLKIDSAQPRIIENKQGLLVDFKLHGCEVNGGVAQPTLLADFGDIAANRSGVARWLMTSSLSGRFVEFSAYYTHADELGGQLTSLITGQPMTHFLLQDVVVDLPGRDTIRDFLARDGFDLRVYESENADTAVVDQSTFSSLVSDGGHHRIRTTAIGGFLFIRVTDPLGGRRVLRSVQRSDGKQLPGPNGWLSQTWDRTAKKWDYYVNVFDVNNAAGADYLLQYKDAPGRTNRAPRLDALSNWVIGPGDHLSFPITATDLDGDRLTFQLDTPAPSWTSVTPEGTFAWQPGHAAVPSTNRLTVVVTDNGLPALSDRRSFTVIVRSSTGSRPPVLTLSTNRLVYPEQSGVRRVDPLAIVTDPDSTTFDRGRLTVAIVEGSMESDALALADPGPDQTNLVITAGNVVEYRSVPIGILTVSSGPTNVLVVDFNAQATVAAVQEVVRTVTFRNDVRRGPSVERVIQFTLNDGAGGENAPVDLPVEIEPANAAPVAVTDLAATTSGVPIGLLIPKLAGNDSDADGDGLMFELLGSVTEQRGVVDVVGNVVVYVPDPNLVGTDSFRYRITDAYGGWAEADVVVTVSAAASPGRTIVAVTPGNDGSVTVKFLGIPGRTYTVQWSFDLLYWTELTKAAAGPTGQIEITDRTADPSRRFYRIVYP